MVCAGSSGDSVTEVVPLARQPREEDGFPGLYATSLPEQLFQKAEVALLTSQWANTTEIVKVDLDKARASSWVSSAEDNAPSNNSCAVLSSHKGKVC